MFLGLEVPVADHLKRRQAQLLETCPVCRRAFDTILLVEITRRTTRLESKKKQASGRRYDIELVVLDYITGNPVKHPFQDHKIIGTAALVLFSNFDEKVCEREIQSIIRSLEGLATHDGKFYMVKRIGRHTIERPALSHLHKFDGRAINSFKGNGKLYIRLASPSGISSPSPSSDEDEEEEDYNELQTEQEQQQDNDHDDYYDKNDGNDNDDIEMTYISRPRQRPMQVTIDETHSTPPSPTSQEQLDYEHGSEEMTFPDVLKREKAITSNAIMSKYGLHNYGETCAVSVVITLLQYFQDVMMALKEDTAIGSAILDLMAVRGSNDKRIVEDAIRCFLCAIRMESGGQLDVLEVLEKTFQTIESCDEVLLKTIKDLLRGEWSKVITCQEKSVSKPHPHGPIHYIAPSPDERRAPAILSDRYGPKPCSAVSTDVLEEFGSTCEDSLPDDASESTRCTLFPELFLLAVMRTKDDGEKDNGEVIFPQMLPFGILKQSDISDGGFRLKALIIHSQIRSHVSLIVKNSNQVDSWTLFDDAKVTCFKMNEDIRKYISGGKRNDSIICAIYAQPGSFGTYPFRLPDEKRKEILRRLKDESAVSLRPSQTSQAVNLSEECENLQERIEEHLQEIQGMEELKDRLRTIARNTVLDKLRARFGAKVIQEPLNLVFMGNPGTGKTTVARLFAAILKDIGVIAENKLIEVQRDDIVGEHIGQTEAKTAKKIEEAKGGILFIDEAYQLNREGSKVDFGLEAVGVIMKNLNQEGSKHSKTIFILAGYERQMKRFMHMNKGLFRRFREPVYFRDYNANELGSIMKTLVRKQGFRSEENISDWHDFFSALPTSYISLFNGAICNRALIKLKESLSTRVVLNNVTREELFKFTRTDYNNALNAMKLESTLSLEQGHNAGVDKTTQVKEADFDN